MYIGDYYAMTVYLKWRFSNIRKLYHPILLTLLPTCCVGYCNILSRRLPSHHSTQNIVVFQHYPSCHFSLFTIVSHCVLFAQLCPSLFCMVLFKTIPSHSIEHYHVDIHYIPSYPGRIHCLSPHSIY